MIAQQVLVQPPPVLILADPRDGGAELLLSELGLSAQKILPHHLSRSGWCYRNDGSSSTFASDTGAHCADLVEDVVVLLHAVLPEHIPHVIQTDRVYVAAEMTAFLRAWLDSLSCRKWNHTTRTSLAGGDLGPVELRSAAAAAGIPVGPPATTLMPTLVSESRRSSVRSIAVVEGRTKEGSGDVAAQRARALAASVGFRMLRVDLDNDDRVMAAGALTDMHDIEVVELVAEALRSNRSDR